MASLESLDVTNETLDALLRQLQGRMHTQNSGLIREMGLQVERGRKEQADLRASQLSAIPLSFKPKIEQDQDTGIVTASAGDHTVRIHARELTDELRDDLRIALHSRIQLYNNRKSA